MARPGPSTPEPGVRPILTDKRLGCCCQKSNCSHQGTGGDRIELSEHMPLWTLQADRFIMENTLPTFGLGDGTWGNKAFPLGAACEAAEPRWALHHPG